MRQMNMHIHFCQGLDLHAMATVGAGSNRSREPRGAGGSLWKQIPERGLEQETLKLGCLALSPAGSCQPPPQDLRVQLHPTLPCITPARPRPRKNYSGHLDKAINHSILFCREMSTSIAACSSDWATRFRNQTPRDSSIGG